ncbi:MAG: protoporphyrinogen oxidase [Pirellulales bacterium]|nr:protoporphyrinogen oxidase [Pirellulales bacterium]
MPAEPSTSSQARYAVIGGGISGLSAAYRLTQLSPGAAVELFEAGDRLGGVLHTHRDGGLLIERGADSFLNKNPCAFDLCQEIGLADQLIPTNEGQRRAFLLCRGALYPVPDGFVVYRPQRLGPILQSPILSWWGKLRLLSERWVPRLPGIHRADFDESAASFAIRRLGRETFERLVQPLLAGIYTADPYQLSVAATIPEAIEAVREFGSLRRAALRAGDPENAESSGARYASFLSLRGGLVQLIQALAGQLDASCCHLNAPVRALRQVENHSWLIEQDDGTRRGPFQGIVIALPAPRVVPLVSQLDARLGELLARIPYASSAVVSLVFRRDQIGADISGFGVVIPSVEGRQIVAASFSSNKFSGRAPEGQVLVRVFLGGALHPKLLQLPDDQLCEVARAELSEVLHIRGHPLSTDMIRWHEKMPQYHVGHVKLVGEIEAQIERWQGLELAGNAYHGVGISQCIQSGENAARRIVQVGL